MRVFKQPPTHAQAQAHRARLVTDVGRSSLAAISAKSALASSTVWEYPSAVSGGGAAVEDASPPSPVALLGPSPAPPPATVRSSGLAGSIKTPSDSPPSPSMILNSVSRYLRQGRRRRRNKAKSNQMENKRKTTTNNQPKKKKKKKKKKGTHPAK